MSAGDAVGEDAGRPLSALQQVELIQAAVLEFERHRVRSERVP